VAYQQAKDSHDAGVGTDLDVLRAQVQLQTQQQAVINSENAFAKDKIVLNRMIGLPVDQEITLTDTAPYAEFAELPLADAMRLAFLSGRTYSACRLNSTWRYRREGGEDGAAAALAFHGYTGTGSGRRILPRGVRCDRKISVPVFQEGSCVAR
jgi:hypothetical protein